MTNLKKLVYFSTFVFFFSCKAPIEKLGDFKLLPSPQEFEIKGNSTLKYDDVKLYFSENTELPVLNKLLKSITASENSAKAQIIYSIDSSLNIAEQGYTLEITNKQIHIVGKDKAGLFYGFKSLEQLINDAKEQEVYLPECSIKDFPLLSNRSIHLDVKHHLEKKDYYHKLINKLASYKINGIIIELEDKLKYKRQPEIASDDALSIEELKGLSDYAKKRHIEISPLIQGLGHASFVLKHDKYKALRDNPNSDWAFNPLDPKTYEVQFDLYLDAMEATPHGKYLHIGGDEVHTSGRNSGKSALELQLIWLEKVCKFAEEHNRIPIFWDDMPLKIAGVYPTTHNSSFKQKQVDSIWNANSDKLSEIGDKFPKNCIYMRWNYMSPDIPGNKKAMKWYAQNNLKAMGATAGQTRWVLMPQNESNIDNIKSFALSSIKNKLNGLLLTLWDDDSPHFELYMRGILGFSEYTWAGGKKTKEEFKTAYRQKEFSNEVARQEFAFIDSLEKSVIFWKNALLKDNRRNYLASSKNALNDLIDFPNEKKGTWSETHKERLKKAKAILENCDTIALKIIAFKSKVNKNRYTLDVYEQVNKFTQYAPKVLLALNAFDIADNNNQKLKALKTLKQLKYEFNEIRKEFEMVYSKTRILNKPQNYILDQDHHAHLANQSISFDWQFYAEMLFLRKLDEELLNKVKKTVN